MKFLNISNLNDHELQTIVTKIPKIEAMFQTEHEYDIHWHIYLKMGLILEIAF